MVFFGQIVIGPPGSGKTTYCYGMQQMCGALSRKCLVINLDPANDEVPYDCGIDIRNIITVDQVMDEHNLGPNGGLMFCMEFLLTNFHWLETQLKKHQGAYLILDCPGQVELYSHHSALLGVLNNFKKYLDARFTVVHLMDSVLCTEASKYISALLVTLSGQIMLNSPHVNCLTKIDLLRHHSKDLAFRLEYFSEVQDLKQLLETMEGRALTPKHPMDVKFRNLNAEICELVSDFNLIAFLPLDISSKESVIKVLQTVDTANGFLLADDSLSDPTGLFKIAIAPSLGLNEQTFGTLQERYVDVSESDEDNEIQQK